MSKLMTGAAPTRLLMVEDNPGDARLLCEMLNDGHDQAVEVIRASCLAEAEVLLKAGGFGLILLDLALPDADGLEAVRRVGVTP